MGVLPIQALFFSTPAFAGVSYKFGSACLVLFFGTPALVGVFCEFDSVFLSHCWWLKIAKMTYFCIFCIRLERHKVVKVIDGFLKQSPDGLDGGPKCPENDPKFGSFVLLTFLI